MAKLLPSETLKNIRVKQIKSTIGLTQKQISSVRGLGLKKIGSEVTLANTRENRGMVNAVRFLLHVEEA